MWYTSGQAEHSKKCCSKCTTYVDMLQDSLCVNSAFGDASTFRTIIRLIGVPIFTKLKMGGWIRGWMVHVGPLGGNGHMWICTIFRIFRYFQWGWVLGIAFLPITSMAMQKKKPLCMFVCICIIEDSIYGICE